MCWSDELCTHHSESAEISDCIASIYHDPLAHRRCATGDGTSTLFVSIALLQLTVPTDVIVSVVLSEFTIHCRSKGVQQ